MKLVLKQADNPINERISIVKKEIPCLDSSWHYHPQYELIYISQSYGIRFVGDSVSPFTPGDLVLVGAYVPHLWRNDPSYYEEGGSTNIKTIVLKFMLDFMGKDTFENPEFLDIKHLLEESKFGICFPKSVSQQFNDELLEIVELSPGMQSIRMLDILYRLSKSTKWDVLSSSDMRQYTTGKSDRLDAVLKYISDNYNQPITLEDVSDVACMTTNSFCRFFKKMTNKSFIQFLNEIRIRNATRLLIQDQLPVSEVCYTVGYNSITNFNKQFKQITGITPNNYRRAV